MTIARCDKYTPNGTKDNYKVFALPVGYPATAAICGRAECLAPARVWLSEPERIEHEAGNRIFGIKTMSAKLRVRDELISD
jgi:hypothetical protein